MEKIMKYRSYSMTNLVDAKLSVAKELIEKAIEKFGPDAHLSFDYSEYCDIEINYKELETDAEFESRMKMEELRKERRRKEYEALKKEFEGD